MYSSEGWVDLVVEDFASIPRSLARSFLQQHVHADAINGRMLLQLIDEPRAIRIDLFHADYWRGIVRCRTTAIATPRQAPGRTRLHLPTIARP
jgi:hypothetical protein